MIKGTIEPVKEGVDPSTVCHLGPLPGGHRSIVGSEPQGSVILTGTLIYSSGPPKFSLMVCSKSMPSGTLSLLWATVDALGEQ
jgi:hypothetical protein